MNNRSENSVLWHLVCTALGIFVFFAVLGRQDAEFLYSFTKIFFGIAFLFILVGSARASFATKLLGGSLLLCCTLYIDSLPIKWIIFAPFLYLLVSRRKDLDKIDVSSVDLLLNSLLASSLILYVRGGNSFLAWKKLINMVLGGDSLFHAALASMIKTYQVPSTGLQGLVEIPYHFFSHAIFASLSGLLAVPVLDLYPLVMALGFCPLLLTTLAYSAYSLDDKRNSFASYFRYAVLLVWIVVLLPLDTFVLWDSFFISESYTLALSYLLLALPLLRSEKLTETTAAFLLIVLAGITKGSVGLMGLGLAWLNLWFIFNKPSRWKYGGSLILTTAVFVSLTLGMVKMAAGATSLRPFAFILQYSWGGAPLFVNVLLFYGLHFIVSWLVLIGWIRRDGIKSIFLVPNRLFSLAVLAVGILGASLIDIPGGAAYYFSSVALFVSIATAGNLVSKDLSHRYINIILVVCLLVFVFKGWKKPNLKADGKDSSLVEKLQELKALRDLPTDSQFYSLNSEDSPVGLARACVSDSFVFTAVSERAWVGLLSKSVESCPAAARAYANYVFFSDGAQLKLIDPKIKLIPFSFGEL